MLAREAEGYDRRVLQGLGYGLEVCEDGDLAWGIWRFVNRQPLCSEGPPRRESTVTRRARAGRPTSTVPRARGPLSASLRPIRPDPAIPGPRNN